MAVLRRRDLKRYPHFDAPISMRHAEALVQSPERVARHAFYPFIMYKMRWRRFAQPGLRTERPPKEREIRMAAHRDACIFAYYRKKLSELYETELRQTGTDGSVLAYRHIPKANGRGGKCNIDFACDAFSYIKTIGDCFVVASDISQYFESIDHALLKENWRRLLGIDRLPMDHFSVFRAITEYSIVEKEKLYERLGYFGPKRKLRDGSTVPGYLLPFKDVPRQLCTPAAFREKVAGSGPKGSIIETNRNSWGIPQGSPISDLLANFYLLDFDTQMAKRAQELEGRYLRYSDDILFIGKCSSEDALSLAAEIEATIAKFGTQLRIKKEKTDVWIVSSGSDGQEIAQISGSTSRNGVSYLGFRYDGEKVYIRNSTISNLYRKVSLSARAAAQRHARRYPDKDQQQLKTLFDMEAFIQRFGRVREFEQQSNGYRSWTFWTYAKRAADTFGQLGTPILGQLAKHRRIVAAKVNAAIERAASQRTFSSQT